MAICAQCSSSIQRIRPQNWPERGERDINVKLPTFSRAGVHNCWICFKFSQWLGAENPDLLEEWCQRSLLVKFKASVRFRFMEPKQDIMLPFSVLISPLGHGEDDDGCEIELGFINASGISRQAFAAPKSQSTTGVIDHWMDMCTKGHKKCRENGEQWYPSRLLRLGSHCREVKLIISNDRPPTGPYMTLSHRWGPHSFTRLTLSTMEQLQNSIDVPNLLQSFQDAIKIAEHLGINHLWIDALCILQDKNDLSVFERESQDMDKIYSCALLNVSATMSRDGSESFLKKSSWDLFLPSEIELEIDGLVQNYYVLDANIWYDEISDAPLNKRGWVFQERFLARRVLHFGERQMAWECREVDALEMFPDGLPRASVTSSMSKSNVANTMANLTQRLSDQTPDLKLVKLWQNLVNEYTKCKLTLPKDKLIAFAGVAKWMMKARTDHYAAGMWEKGMVYDLAWWRLSEDRKAFPISNTSSRAPSWSWASVDGEILFPLTLGGVQAHFIDIVESAEPMTNERFALAPQESIRIKGHCIRLGIEGSNNGIFSFTVAGFRFFEGDGAQSSSLDLEILEEELFVLVQRGRVSFLPLFATSYFLYGIVLANVDGICSHRRLGAVEIPIMVRDASEEVGEEHGETPRPGQSQLGAWVTMQSSSQPVSNNQSWSMAAVKLLHYILEPQRVRHIIDIY